MSGTEHDQDQGKKIENIEDMEEDSSAFQIDIADLNMSQLAPGPKNRDSIDLGKDLPGFYEKFTKRTASPVSNMAGKAAMGTSGVFTAVFLLSAFIFLLRHFIAKKDDSALMIFSFCLLAGHLGVVPFIPAVGQTPASDKPFPVTDKIGAVATGILAAAAPVITVAGALSMVAAYEEGQLADNSAVQITAAVSTVLGLAAALTALGLHKTVQGTYQKRQAPIAPPMSDVGSDVDHDSDNENAPLLPRNV